VKGMKEETQSKKKQRNPHKKETVINDAKLKEKDTICFIKHIK
jgi:hypothetical protein